MILGEDLDEELQIQDLKFTSIIWSNLKTRDGIFAVLGLAVCVIVSVYVLLNQEQQRMRRYREETVAKCKPFADALRIEVQKSMASAYAVGSFVKVNKQMENSTLQNFNAISETFLNTYEDISTMQLAPCGTVSHIHPLQGNEAALGRNMLQGHYQAESLQAINNREFIFLGPIRLPQGDLAIEGRYPVFTTAENLPEACMNTSSLGVEGALS
jgi:sensor domain CHASE-containing protein